jgi:hypothetical protein
MYTHEILLFLTWPVLIYLSYLLSSAAIKRYEKKHEESSE